MDDQIKQLAAARETLEGAKSLRQKLQAELEASPAYQKCLAAERQAKEQAEALRAMIEQTALEYPDRLHAAVKIRMETTLEYDPATALEWCRQNMNALLILDTKAFENLAKNGAVNGMPVLLGKKPKVTIATDLSKWLE